MRGNAGIKADAEGMAKNPAGFCLRKSLFSGHSRRVVEDGQNLMVLASVSLLEIVPGHPRRWMGRQFTCVPLQLSEVVEGIGVGEFAGVDQAHEQIPGFGAVQRTIK